MEKDCRLTNEVLAEERRASSEKIERLANIIDVLEK